MFYYVFIPPYVFIPDISKSTENFKEFYSEHCSIYLYSITDISLNLHEQRLE